MLFCLSFNWHLTASSFSAIVMNMLIMYTRMVQYVLSHGALIKGWPWFADCSGEQLCSAIICRWPYQTLLTMSVVSVEKLNVKQYRFSVFWLRSNLICGFRATTILNWILDIGGMPGTCSALATGRLGIAVLPGMAQIHKRSIQTTKNNIS